MKDKEIIEEILDRKTALRVLQDLSKRMSPTLDLFGEASFFISRPNFEVVRKKYLDELPKDSVVLSREEYERLLRKYFVIKVLPYGYYTGINKKYGEIFDCSDKKFAKRFSSVEETKSVTKMLDKAGYEYFVEEVNEDLQSSKETAEKFAKTIKTEIFSILSSKNTSFINKEEIQNCSTMAKQILYQINKHLNEDYGFDMPLFANNQFLAEPELAKQLGVEIKENKND